MSEIWGRTVEKATRLALIAAVSAGSGVIEREHAEWAARHAMVSDSALQRVAGGNISETKHGRLCNDVSRDLVKGGVGGVAIGMLATRCRPYRDASPSERRAALATLVEDGRMKREARTAGNGHRFDLLIATRISNE